MENNLINDLRNYIINAIKDGKVIEKETIFDLINIIKTYYSLDSYIRKIKIDSSETRNMGDYYKGQLTICLNALKNNINEEAFLLDLKRNDITYFLYYEVLATILHEVEHANQEMIFFSCNDDIESLIIKNAYGIDIPKLLNKGISHEEINKLCKKGKRYYTQNYDLSPIERLADVKAFRMAIEVFNFNSDDISLMHIRNFAISNLWDAYMRSYENHLNPTETFIQGYNPYGDLEKIQAIVKYLPFAKRFFYGLEISEKEHEYIEEKANKIFDKI